MMPNRDTVQQAEERRTMQQAKSANELSHYPFFAAAAIVQQLALPLSFL